ncbi:TPA: hypothetical protein HA361_02635 [Candidatus Woesearchaeota archaeon]|nr:hypothetical protein [Candidatus Woesearchaeota archaeon]HII69416.1 hypothetical protein [Candidatus Woesearchaeota archaeon]
MHARKAQGISINTIVIAAIALVVLVVVIAIFTGNLGSFATDLKNAKGDQTKICSSQAIVGVTSSSIKTLEECQAVKGRTILAADAGSGSVCCIVQV